MAGIDPEPKVEARGIPTPYNDNKAADAAGYIQQATNRLVGIADEAGAEIGALYDREKKKSDALVVNNKLAALQKRGTDELYGTSDPSSQQAGDAAFDGVDPGKGFFATRGVTATQLGPDQVARLNGARQQLHDSLQNQSQKELFSSQSQQLLTQWYGQIEQHSFREMQVARQDSITDSTAEAVRAAALNPSDDKAAQEAIARVVGAQDAIVTSPQNAFARADTVRAQVTKARLDTLLAQPAGSGFPEATRVLKDNRAVLGAFADDYDRRIEQANVAAVGAVEANRIVEAAMPGTAQQRYFRMPNENVVETELAKLAGRDPKLFGVAAPIARAQLALRKNAVKEGKDQFVDQAVATYNTNHATFFSSDIADRLNHVDPDKYRSLWTETYQRAKNAGDNSAQARREQKARDDEAVNDFKSMDPNERATTDTGSFSAGRDLSPVGVSRLSQAQQAAKASVAKGLAVPQAKFLEDAAADAQGFLPAAQTKKQREQRTAAEKQFKARADEAFSTFVTKHERSPTPDEAADLRAGLVKGKVPLSPEASDLSARSMVNNVNGAPQSQRKVEVVGPGGARALANETGLDAWLSAHPKWKRR